MNIFKSIADAYVLLNKGTIANHQHIDHTNPGQGCVEGCEACAIANWIKQHKEVYTSYRMAKPDKPAEPRTKSEEAFVSMGQVNMLASLHYHKVAKEEFYVGRKVLILVGDGSWVEGTVSLPCRNGNDLVRVNTATDGACDMNAYRLRLPKEEGKGKHEPHI